MYNRYYSYSNRTNDKPALLHIGAVGETDIILGIATVNAEDNNIAAAMMLNQQEQDDLIAGILERRGVDTWAVQEFLAKWKVIKEEYPLTTKGISANGVEKSKIHPPKK